MVRSAEATDMQMKELDSDSSVHGIGREKDESIDKKTPSDNEGKRHGVRECPAYGKTCNRIVGDQIISRVYADHRKNVHRLGVEQQEEHDPK